MIPNETYETFVSQYQSEIVEVYGDASAGAETRNIHKGLRLSEKRINRNDDLFNSPSFKEFWKRLSRKTDYLVAFDEKKLIDDSIRALNQITILAHVAEVSLNRIADFSETEITTVNLGSETKMLPSAFYSALDIVEELSENSSLAYPTVFSIVMGLTNHAEIIKNPPRFIQEAAKRLREIELNEMLRALDYRLNGEEFDLAGFEEFIVRNTDRIEPTPYHGVYDHIVYESEFEKEFAKNADTDTEVVCFLKLPSFYMIATPVGPYNPDFGLVLKKKRLREEGGSEFYFVIETKGTNDIEDRKSLSRDEAYKIRCALKHFEALGIEAKVNYIAPVKEYSSFKTRAGEMTVG